MGFDEFGILWLFDPWVAGVVLTGILGVVLWSHGWIVTGAPPRPLAMAVRLQHEAEARRAQLRRSILARRAAGVVTAAAPAPRSIAPTAIVHLDHHRRPRSAA